MTIYDYFYNIATSAFKCIITYVKFHTKVNNAVVLFVTSIQIKANLQFSYFIIGEILCQSPNIHSNCNHLIL